MLRHVFCRDRRPREPPKLAFARFGEPLPRLSAQNNVTSLLYTVASQPTPHPSIARDPDATSGIAHRVRLRVAVTLSEAKRNRMGLATLRDEGFPETSEREFWGFAIRMTTGDRHLPPLGKANDVAKMRPTE